MLLPPPLGKVALVALLSPEWGCEGASSMEQQPADRAQRGVGRRGGRRAARALRVLLRLAALTHLPPAPPARSAGAVFEAAAGVHTRLSTLLQSQLEEHHNDLHQLNQTKLVTSYNQSSCRTCCRSATTSSRRASAAPPPSAPSAPPSSRSRRCRCIGRTSSASSCSQVNDVCRVCSTCVPSVESSLKHMHMKRDRLAVAHARRAGPPGTHYIL